MSLIFFFLRVPQMTPKHWDCLLQCSNVASDEKQPRRGRGGEGRERRDRKYSKKLTGLLDVYGEMSNRCSILVPHTTFHSHSIFGHSWVLGELNVNFLSSFCLDEVLKMRGLSEGHSQQIKTIPFENYNSSDMWDKGPTPSRVWSALL